MLRFTDAAAPSLPLPTTVSGAAERLVKIARDVMLQAPTNIDPLPRRLIRQHGHRLGVIAFAGRRSRAKRPF
jgi:hypothetical protein